MNITEKYRKSFSQPSERREFQAHGHLDVLSFADGTSIGRGIFEPGWRWSNDVKPIAGTMSCLADHTGVCLRGRMTIRMDNGDEVHIGPGDAFRIPPGHDAWVEGNEPCEMLDITGFAEYATDKIDREAA